MSRHTGRDANSLLAVLDHKFVLQLSARRQLHARGPHVALGPGCTQSGGGGQGRVRQGGACVAIGAWPWQGRWRGRNEKAARREACMGARRGGGSWVAGAGARLPMGAAPSSVQAPSWSAEPTSSTSWPKWTCGGGREEGQTQGEAARGACERCRGGGTSLWHAGLGARSAQWRRGTGLGVARDWQCQWPFPTQFGRRGRRRQLAQPGSQQPGALAPSNDPYHRAPPPSRASNPPCASGRTEQSRSEQPARRRRRRAGRRPGARRPAPAGCGCAPPRGAGAGRWVRRWPSLRVKTDGFETSRVQSACAALGGRIGDWLQRACEKQARRSNE